MLTLKYIVNILKPNAITAENKLTAVMRSQLHSQTFYRQNEQLTVFHYNSKRD